MIISEKNNILLIVIIFFTLIVLLFYFTNGNEEKNDSTAHSVSPVPLATQTDTPAKVPQNNAVNVQEDTGDHSIVRYEHDAFIPGEITVKNETGCFVNIKNTSDQEVIPRLGPYDQTKEKGFLYPSILPHASSFIDPRYGNTKKFTFYNKNNPQATFIAHIDPTCL